MKTSTVQSKLTGRTRYIGLEAESFKDQVMLGHLDKALENGYPIQIVYPSSIVTIEMGPKSSQEVEQEDE